MKSKYLIIYILLFAIVALSAACATTAVEAPASTEAGADVESMDTETDSDGSVADGDTDASGSNYSPLSPLPEPPAETVAVEEEAPEEAPVIEAEYDDETGAVTGLLRAYHKDGDVRPLANAVIGLGTLVPRDDGEGNIGVAYSPSDSPRATIGEDGTFSINNVEPGEYGVILDAVVSQSLLSMPDDSGDFLLEVKAGEQLDLGILEYETLSYPGFVK